MPSYIVRPTTGGDQSGARGANGAVIHAASPDAAREAGAIQLGVSPAQVKVEELPNSTTFLAVQTKPGMPPPESDDDIEIVTPSLAPRSEL